MIAIAILIKTYQQSNCTLVCTCTYKKLTRSTWATYVRKRSRHTYIHTYIHTGTFQDLAKIGHKFKKIKIVLFANDFSMVG